MKETMEITKSLKDISWDVPEETYRADPALSYSTLAKFEREGFNKLGSLFDKVESPSLTFGSAVDSIITGGQKEFDERFLVAEFPLTPDSIIVIVRDLFSIYNLSYNDLNSIPTDTIIRVAEKYNYQSNWKPETRAKVIREKGNAYYQLLYISQGKTILSQETYQDVVNAVQALKESSSTKFYFNDNPFDNIERLYQLKFKHEFNGIMYRGMLDLVLVDHDNKKIYPIDLKTSYKEEWDFYKSFLEWHYFTQARLYYRLLNATIKEDDYFKDFEIDNYRFIVVNRRTLTPLVWKFPETKMDGALYIGKAFNIKIRDPFDIGAELNYYLTNNPQVPVGIKINDDNNITEWINKL